MLLVLSAVCAEHQHRRRIGGFQQSLEKVRAIDITPLQIVDQKYQRMPVTDASQHLSQGREAPAAQFDLIGDRSRSRRSVGDLRNALHH